MTKTFEFTVTLNGKGDTPEEAWDDAVQAFSTDPCDPDTTVEGFNTDED